MGVQDYPLQWLFEASWWPIARDILILFIIAGFISDWLKKKQETK